MTTENIGSIYPTKIPGIADSADIQVALKTYHYGSSTVPTTRSDVNPNSVAGYIRALEDRVAALETQGIGSIYQSEAPTGVADGFVWIDSDTASPVFNSSMVSARYQISAPTTDLIDGQLWVDKDSTPLKIYVYDAETTAWRAIGS
jgi:stage V sporulation protein SpoVS